MGVELIYEWIYILIYIDIYCGLGSVFDIGEIEV